MANTYTYLTRAQFESVLALRLAETCAGGTFVKFASAELDLYLAEALRTFSALTGIWQDTGSATVPAGSAFVDLTTLFPALRGQTLKDQDLVGIIQYHLLEPYNPSGWSGSEQYSLAVITQALQRRRDQFLLDTGCVISQHSGLSVDPLDEGELSLDQSIIDIRRAAWTTLEGLTIPLWPASNWALRGFNAAWNLSPGLPRTYAYNQYAPGILQLGPPNSSLGTVDLLTVDAGAALDPTVGVLLGVPDDFAPGIKWGALADLFSADGPGRDFARAAHCESMYGLFVQAAKSATVLIDARFNNQLAQFSTIGDLDAAPTMRNWQGRTSPVPPRWLVPVGLNLCGIALPSSADAQLQVTISTNAPIPTSAGSNVQIPKEYLDVLVGYVEHLAMFKIAGREFSATQPLAEQFFAAAQSRNYRLAAISVFEDDQRIFSGLHEGARPRSAEPDKADKQKSQSNSGGVGP